MRSFDGTQASVEAGAAEAVALDECGFPTCLAGGDGEIGGAAAAEDDEVVGFHQVIFAMSEVISSRALRPESHLAGRSETGKAAP